MPSIPEAVGREELPAADSSSCFMPRRCREFLLWPYLGVVIAATERLTGCQIERAIIIDKATVAAAPAKTYCPLISG
jgi:hypothetical protein